MNTLISVDWDYFFPRLNEFDWGHKEAKLFFEVAWTTRVADISIMTKENALDIMHPDQNLLQSFWDKACPNPPRILVVAESHADLLPFIKMMKPSRVINYDTHHDYYYYDKPPKTLKQADCSNWGYFALRNKYTKSIIWARPDSIEPPTVAYLPDNFTTQTGFVEDIGFVDCLFICRSFAWTPTWCDHYWMNFVGYWQENYPNLWQYRSFAKSTLIERSPNLEEAKELRIKFIEGLQLLQDFTSGIGAGKKG